MPGVAGKLTPALLELGWIPRDQGLEALIFLSGFMVLDGAGRESSEAGPAPGLITSSEHHYNAASGVPR